MIEREKNNSLCLTITVGQTAGVILSLPPHAYQYLKKDVIGLEESPEDSSWSFF